MTDHSSENTDYSTAWCLADDGSIGSTGTGTGVRDSLTIMDMDGNGTYSGNGNGSALFAYSNRSPAAYL